MRDELRRAWVSSCWSCPETHCNCTCAILNLALQRYKIYYETTNFSRFVMKVVVFCWTLLISASSALSSAILALVASFFAVILDASDYALVSAVLNTDWMLESSSARVLSFIVGATVVFLKSLIIFCINYNQSIRMYRWNHHDLLLLPLDLYIQ